MGINQRNASLIMPYNPRRLYPLVDDKLKTKALVSKHGISVPNLYAVFKRESDIKQTNKLLNTYPNSVIKPAAGSGGNGVLVLDGKVNHYYKKTNGDLINIDSIKHHISNILSGIYSLGGTCDKAILEYKVQPDPIFSAVAYKGVPDIRVIVFKGIPIAAMLRLPTMASDGKANLHQGAVGVGIDLNSGITTHAVLHNRICTRHPDTQQKLSGINIPQWDKVLKIALSCADSVALGYLGIDIVLDHQLGPLMLELNARPGLNVQLAIRSGLSHRVDYIKNKDQLPEDHAARISLMKDIYRSSNQ